MPEEKIDRLVESVIRLEEATKNMRVRMDKFDVDMQSIATSLAQTSDALIKIRNIMILVVVALLASGVDLKINMTHILKALGI